ncbi:hypothetical protein B4N84_28560 [Flavobacterium sp. IR1]|nr:hypothetical protein B4N84_28560 [Flavobacterium sp. IR1]
MKHNEDSNAKKKMFTEKILVCELQDNPLLAPLIGAEGTRLQRDARDQGDPTGALRRGGSRSARGKRAPAAEVNTFGRGADF